MGLPPTVTSRSKRGARPACPSPCSWSLSASKAAGARRVKRMTAKASRALISSSLAVGKFAYTLSYHESEVYACLLAPDSGRVFATGAPAAPRDACVNRRLASRLQLAESRLLGLAAGHVARQEPSDLLSLSP